MVSLRRFDISSISRKLNGINARISVDNCALFPCLTLLSSYQFKKRFVKILPNGDIQGGFTRMIISLIDFSFVRSLTAQRYTIKGPPPYDPVSLFLLELFRYIDQYPNMDQFLKDLRDKDKGWAYRAYAGIHMDNIPSKGTFSHFKARLGEGLYMDEAMSQNQIHTAILFGVKEQLDKQGLCLNTIRSNIVEVAPDMDRIILRCPKIPTDTDARIGVRNDPKNSARKQKIFGYNMVLSTSVELDLKLELPVAVVNMAGNGKEGET